MVLRHIFVWSSLWSVICDDRFLGFCLALRKNELLAEKQLFSGVALLHYTSEVAYEHQSDVFKCLRLMCVGRCIWTSVFIY